MALRMAARIANGGRGQLATSRKSSNSVALMTATVVVDSLFKERKSNDWPDFHVTTNVCGVSMEPRDY
jgi:hypothetical protein